MASEAATYQNLTVFVDQDVATITLNRPESLNSLNMALKADLAGAIQQLASDTTVRCVVVTGAGKAFCAGGDIGEMTMNDTPVHSRSRLQVLLREIFIPLAEMEKPTIASVNGHAFGAGLSLALACDLIVASEVATMSCAFATMGLLPDCGSLYFLPRRLPMNVAKELIFTGRRFSAAEALDMNLVNTVVPANDLVNTTTIMARELAAGPTIAFGIAKRLLDLSHQTSLHEMSLLEEFGQAVLFSTDDHLAAREAFLTKSKALFKGS
jgi:2-(1,2-epoxy-1,2-dihydrophenyl)acetyl-CoA isomerase